MKKVLKWVGLTFVGLIVLGMIINATKTPEEKAAKTEQDQAQAQQEIDNLPSVSASEIASEYNENTVAADQKFKDQKFKVTGTIADINTDFMGDPYLTLKGGVNQFMEPQFGFEKSDAAQLANFAKGQKVTLICIGKGDVAKTPMSGSCSIL
ncbi:MAG: hypothetical protein Q8M39_06115 [Sulfuricurvum sp.]|nr:hypothetical protein [Sulfuricurvum sp.]